jgi:serine phosphatase RsbU (regulator of sigma subunit)
LKTHGRTIGTIVMASSDPGATFNENDISLAETIAYQAAAAIENAQVYKETETELGAVEQDMDIGRQIQSGFFPESIPQIEGWEFAAHFEPSRQVAGDFYDFFKFEQSNMMAVVIADVCDKGVGAALFMVLFRSLLRAFSRVEVYKGNAGEQLKRIIKRTNDYVAEIHGESNMFATMFMGILDSESGTLHYVNGGHEPPVILDKKGKIVQHLQPTGPAVGIFPQADYRVEQIDLQKGDFLMGYTDGTTDARNEDDEIFSKERLMNYIQFPWSSLFSMVFEVKNELHRFAGPHQQFDDITIISMRRKVSNEQEAFAICRDASLEFLPELGAFVEDSALFNQLPRQDALILRNAAEQACGTIIRSGYAMKEPGVLSINLEKMDNRVRLIIRDDGRSLQFPHGVFDAQITAIPSDVFEDGTPLMSEQVQIVSYDAMNGMGNQLVLEREIALLEFTEVDSGLD